MADDVFDPDDDVDQTAVRHPKRSGHVEVPRQLPLPVRDFIGRTDQLTALDNLLRTDPHQAEMAAPSPVVISAVDGAAGIGKTALAVYWAHRVQHHFPDGTLYVNLRGYGPGDPATPTEVLDGFLRALGIRAEAIPQGVDAQSACYRSLLTGRRVLIVLDNANGAEHVRPLLPGAAGCMVVVTSRDSLTGLVVTESATRLTLALLSQEESQDLVREIIGSSREAAEPEAVDELVRLCARLPLALRIAASRVSTSASNISELVAELIDDRYRLDTLSSDRDERARVRAVFDWSYEQLTASEARLFRHLGLHVGPDFSLHAAAAVAGLDLVVARRLLERLAAVHLIEPSLGGRYRFHDLLHNYAGEQARRHEKEPERDHVLELLIDWYAHTARACDELVFPGFLRLPGRATAPANVPAIHDRVQALRWLETERANLLSALQQAVLHEFWNLAIHLADSTAFLSARGSRIEWLKAIQAGLTAAQRSDDHYAETSFHMCRGEALTFLRRWDDAIESYNFGLSIATSLEDQWHQAFGLNGLGVLFCRQRRFTEALEYLQKALTLTHDINTGRFEAVIHGNLSRAYTGLGRYRQALEHGEHDLALRRRLGDPEGEAGALHNVASAVQGLGDHEQAITLSREAITLGRQVNINLDYVVAEPLNTLAKSLQHIGDNAEAITCWSESVAIFTEYGAPERAAHARAQIHHVKRFR
ncbi:tetratricopeptide repeat protein [Amycolatopsis sp. NPDC051061]|uniref:tetratricopeptide repeat protein n=1 Tax=Amycolatopsis sp. NPDC051061 TaxID=3155042 RepID=UPI0034147FA8